jgi:hypothetical protein
MGKELTSLYSVKKLLDGIKDRNISSVGLVGLLTKNQEI